jgi:hypothetical protein
MGDMDDHIVVFKSLLALETSAINRILVAAIEDIIDALKPGIWQIPCLNEFDLHLTPLFPQLLTQPSETCQLSPSFTLIASRKRFSPKDIPSPWTGEGAGEGEP